MSEVIEGSYWLHKNGNIYEVLMLTNVNTTRPDEYPVTVVYENIETGERWSKPLADWHKSRTYVGKERPAVTL